jgi:prepilin-type N-terminal cleavage/methylation domain-containing protein
MRRAFTIVEVLVATVILSGVGLLVYDTLIASTRGIGIDRVTEAKRRLTLDLLERFCHPYSDIELVYPANAPSPAVRQLTLDEALDFVAVPKPSRPVLKQTLANGSVIGFTLAWSRGLVVGRGKSEALRLDKLWVHPVMTKQAPGPAVDSFRMFYVRQ